MTEGKHKDSPDLARSSSAQSPQPPQKKTTSQAQETQVPGHSPLATPTHASSKSLLSRDLASCPDTPALTSPPTCLALLPSTSASTSPAALRTAQGPGSPSPRSLALSYLHSPSCTLISSKHSYMHVSPPAQHHDKYTCILEEGMLAMVQAHSPFLFSRFSARRQGGRREQLAYHARAHTGLQNGMGGPQ